MLGGVGINTAHEMGHKKDALERWLTKITLAQTCYGHFYIEHNRGHHVRVATPEDPASARFGETFWEFLPRSVWGSRSRRGSWRRSGCAGWTRARGTGQNDVLNAWAMSVVLYGALIAVFGAGAHPVHPHLRGVRVHAAGDRQLPRALRAAAAEDRRAVATSGARPSTAGTPITCDQPVPLSPAAAQRSPRQPDAALPDAAQHGGRAEPAERLRVDDRADLLPAAVAQGDGPPGARALRRRHQPGEHPSAGARQGARQVRS